jgi:type I restriction enzyme S subunit
MEGKYQTYPEYKDSGISGLGSIPNHWRVMQLKRTVDRCVNGFWGAEPKKDGNDTIVLRVADFDRPKLSIQDYGYTYRKIEHKERINRQLKLGDLLLEKSGGGAKTLVGQVVLFDKDFEAVTSNFVAKMTPNKGFNSRFLNYVFSRFYSDNINYCSIKQNTGIQNLDSGAYLAEKVGFPLGQEQEGIANFLDHETAKIDTLIDKQQQLINLLKEKRQAVISHAVTKGLNPNVPMRDSGVEWLGQVPAHWALGRLKNALRIRNGKDYKDVEVEEGGYPVYGSGGVFKRSSDYLYDGKSVLFGRKGTIDKPLVVNGKFWTVDTMFYSEVFNNALPEYIYFQATMFPFSLLSTNTALPSMTQEDLLELPFVIPPSEEQINIVSIAQEKSGEYDHLITKAESAIQLMQERRTALISAAVTGKIDVRNWQAPEPSENQNKEEAA